MNFFLNTGAPKFCRLSPWAFLKGQLFLKLQEGKSCIVSLRTKTDIYPGCWAVETVSGGSAAWQTVGSHSVSLPS